MSKLFKYLIPIVIRNGEMSVTVGDKSTSIKLKPARAALSKNFAAIVIIAC